ncbi:MAG: succinylglutamate desuccinylase/aspartoacylase family protein [Patescibacteria group bacterium]|jgi:hypothetical protein
MSNNKNNVRKLQIGVMGSAADLKYAKRIEELAEAVGGWVAKRGATLVFGAEKDYDSLSTAACRGAKKAGGLTVGITYGKGLEVYEKQADVIIASGLERGGGREMSLVFSCDAIITVGGGSGTLTEIAIAYQANIPVVVLKGSGGWSDKLVGQFLDERQRIKIAGADTPEQAVDLALDLIKKKPPASREVLLVSGTHGDEKIGAEAIQLLPPELASKFNWLIGNPLAWEKNQRFTEADLNRSFPGKADSAVYEERRAAEILALINRQKPKYVVDMHGTGAESGVFIIITNPNWDNLALAARFDASRIVIWPSAVSSPTGPLTKFVTCGLELECGPDSEPAVKVELSRILTDFLSQKSPLNFSQALARLKTKEIYWVGGKLEKSDGEKLELADFIPTTVRGERFFPLLVGQYPGVWCYKMRRVALEELINLC